MKKKFLCLFLSIFIFSLTGCVKFNANMDIKKDKSMDYSIIYAIDTTVFGDTTPIETEDKDELIKQGFTVTDYVDGNMKGYTLSKKIKNIDSVSSSSDVNYDLSGVMENKSDYIFSVKKGFLKNTYTAKFNFDASESDLNNDLDDLDQTDDAIIDDSVDMDDLNNNTDEVIIDDTVETDDEIIIDDTDVINSEDDLNLDFDLNTDEMPDFSNAMASSMDLSFNVKLPYAAISNNATSVGDGNKSLSWNLTSDSINTIEFQFELYNLTNIIMVAGGVLLFIIILIIILVISGKKKGKRANTVPDTFTEIPELNNINSNVQPFSEQSFNQQLMSQSSQNNAQSLDNSFVQPSVAPTSNLVPENVQPQNNVEGVTSVMPNVVSNPSVPVETPAPIEQPVVSQVENIFDSNFGIVPDSNVGGVNTPVGDIQPNVQPAVQPNVQPSIQPAVQPNVQPSIQPAVQTNSQPNIFDQQPVVQDSMVNMGAQPVNIEQSASVSGVAEPVQTTQTPVSQETATVEDPFNGESI